jgi:small subunit ribosomal protein S4e
MKNHLKRIAAPKTWMINRKSNTFIVRPKPGAHSMNQGMSLGYIIRDILKLANAMSEVKKLLNNNEVLIDGKRRKDYRMIVGLFDVITIPSLKKYFKVELDVKGRLTVKEIKEEESKTKICKVVGKKMLQKAKIQLNLHDGKNIIGDHSVKVGDSVELDIPSWKVGKVLNFKEGATVFLVGGKHSGSLGKLEKIKENIAVCKVGNTKIETSKNYLFMVS